MRVTLVSLVLFAVIGCYVEANDHEHHSTSMPEIADRKKREGPPHATPRERRSDAALTDEKRQFPPNEGPEGSTPTPSRRKRNSETTTTVMVHPVLEEADAAAESIDESESAGVKKRDTEESANTSTEDDEGTTDGVMEKRDDEEGEKSADGVQGHISRAKRVSHAGSSHKNRPSAVNRLQSNSNVGGTDEEEPQAEHFSHHEYELDSMHGY